MGVRSDMGIFVECQGKEIWSPSLRVGNLFFEQIKALEKVIEKKSGVESFLADTLDIDAEIFNDFIQSCIVYLEKTNNTALFAMFSGCIEVAIALNFEITGKMPIVSKRLSILLERASKVMYPLSDYLAQR
jgi:hypothetical protein